MDKKILVIEDDLDMQKIYQDMLGEEYVDVSYVSNGEDGLQVVKEDGVYLVLLDMILGDSTGDSFLLKLRRDPKGKNIPVIIVSVLNPDVLKSLLKLGNISILEKPVSREKLLGEIQEMATA